MTKRLSLLFTTLLLCFSTNIQATMQEELEYLEKLQNTFEHNSRTQRPPQIKTRKIKKADQTLESYQAVLKKGALVEDLKGEKSIYAPKRLYVKARLQFPGSPYALLLDKDGEALFATKTQNLSSLEEITTIYPTTDPTETYEDMTSFRSIDTGYQLETKLSAHLENIDASYMAKFHNASDSSANGTRFQAETYFLSFLPFNFGVGLSFQSGSFGDELQGDRTSFQGAYFGPVIKAQTYEGENGSLDLFLKAEKSLSLESNDNNIQNSYSSNIWEIGADWSYETFLGRFFAGLSYRVQQVSLKETSASDLRIPSEKDSQAGPSLFIGYRFTINL